MEVSQQDSPPLFIELFAGRASLSRAAIQSGLRVISIDHEVVQPFAPIVTLDLTSSSGQKILWDVLTSPGVEAVHLGLPCCTSSRARERPIPREMRLAGVPEPPPLRSAEFPLGIPGLAHHHQRRIDSANCLYALAIEIILWCHRHKVVISIENPGKQLVVGSFGKTCKGTLHRSGDCPQLFTVCLFSCLLPWLYTKETYRLALNAGGVRCLVSRLQQ